jgi:predicted RNase H-like HicB family nuclease
MPVVDALGFVERIKGSHHIFIREGVEEILNLQPLGSKSKAYQVKQVRGVILKYRLGGSAMSEKYRYEVIIYWSEEDNAFIAEVPELPGCMADGATYAEAVANVEVIIDEWMETARELGREIPDPKGRLTFA